MTAVSTTPVVPANSEITHCTWLGDPDVLIWAISDTRKHIIGAIGADRCRFYGCTDRQNGSVTVRDSLRDAIEDRLSVAVDTTAKDDRVRAEVVRHNRAGYGCLTRGRLPWEPQSRSMREKQGRRRVTVTASTPAELQEQEHRG